MTVEAPVASAREPRWRPRSAAETELAHVGVDERMRIGRGTRRAVSRSSHGDWQPAPDRRDPIDLLEEQAGERLPELNPIRYGRMLVSAFTFFRGAAYVMASDLAGEPRTSLQTQLCGDAHLSNFGTFAGPHRRLVFGLNDFDETLPGPFEWDVKRLVASFEVAGRDRGFAAPKREAIDLAVACSYRQAMRRFAELPTLELWYIHIDRSIEEIVAEWSSRVSRRQLRRFERDIAKARARDSLRAFAKLTRLVDDRPRIISAPPLIVPIEELAGNEHPERIERGVHALINYYGGTLPGDRRRLLGRYRYVHAARKVVGVGSVGTRAWIMLMLGRDPGDPLLLQMKEAQPSVLERFLTPSVFANHGQRVVEGQRLMQATSDIMLGWIRTTEWVDGIDRDFYVRQLWDGKGRVPVDVMDPEGLRSYGELCGWALARAHARAGDAVAISAYLGSGRSFDRAMALFAGRYADQNERDYDALRRAVESGRIEAQTGL
ncbi:MAG TPA: DUF2252 domain-containing protein [Solirubrobacteraceae bacterium]|jgi:uncharacterized protein (DUF2252 family)|nr:DUF2252 domain-containing protein [Solirubrobacteraceae bacterium]